MNITSEVILKRYKFELTSEEIDNIIVEASNYKVKDSLELYKSDTYHFFNELLLIRMRDLGLPNNKEGYLEYCKKVGIEDYTK